MNTEEFTSYYLILPWFHNLYSIPSLEIRNTKKHIGFLEEGYLVNSFCYCFSSTNVLAAREFAQLEGLQIASTVIKQMFI